MLSRDKLDSRLGEGVYSGLQALLGREEMATIIVDLKPELARVSRPCYVCLARSPDRRPATENRMRNLHAVHDFDRLTAQGSLNTF